LRSHHAPAPQRRTLIVYGRGVMRRREGRLRGASPTACPPSRSASAAPTRAHSPKSHSHTMPRSLWLSTLTAIVLFLSGGVAALIVTVDNAMQWRRAPGPSERRFNQSLGAVGGKLYMFGDEDYTSLLSFDPQVLFLLRPVQPCDCIRASRLPARTRGLS